LTRRHWVLRAPLVAHTLRAAGRVLDAAAEEVLSPASPSALNVPIRARRTLVGYHAGRHELQAARRFGGTLNDVGLAAMTESGVRQAPRLWLLATRSDTRPANNDRDNYPPSGQSDPHHRAHVTWNE
jgi:hypothetical protein